MAAVGSFPPRLDALGAKKEKLQKAFSELDGQRSLLANCTIQWKDLEDYFVELEKSVKKKVDELAEKESVLDKREQAIAVREEASLSRVQEQKDAAIAAIFEEKRSWTEERGRKGVGVSSSGGDLKTESAPALDGANQAMDLDTTASKVGIVAADGGGEANGSGQKDAGSKQAKASAVEVRVKPQLKSLCEDMDGEGLRKYIVDHRNFVPAIRKELPSALQSAIDPSRLLLKALEGYDLLEPDTSRVKDTGYAAHRRACILLLESLAQVLADPVLGVDHPVVPSNIKEAAKEVAGCWRSKLDLQGDVNALDAHAFLQLLATFGIASEYDDDILCKLVIPIARRKQTPDLCRSLGLTANMPDVVDKLSKEGKQIEALSFAHAFGIMDRVQPGALLKAYVKESRKAAQVLPRNTPGGRASGQNDSVSKELSALKIALKTVEEYKLENQYPTESLLKRVAQLEKSKADRKRAATSVKVQAKRPRGTGIGVASSTPGGRQAANSQLVGSAAGVDRGLYRSSERKQYGVTGVQPYNLSSTGAYDRRTQAGYGPTYGADGRSPVSMTSSYLYPSDGLASSMYGASAYPNPAAGTYNPSSGTYSGYQYSGSLQPPSGYQSSFIL
eukprot:c26850_g1_i1 orf=369-2219(-)